MCGGRPCGVASVRVLQGFMTVFDELPQLPVQRAGMQSVLHVWRPPLLGCLSACVVQESMLGLLLA